MSRQKMEPRVVVERSITEWEAYQLFRVYKVHQVIVELIENGRTWNRKEVVKDAAR
ncbi:MAG TPA: hypothetical protein VIN08_01615 [Ohtaekwangia sp.]|uniref:hypothetical protein n=1 Tax=Ohtaekwangia sp. TaxID=2066019 RepID=UPI002F93B3F4